MVDIVAQSYQIMRQYMIRLSEEGFSDPAALGRYAALAGLPSEDSQRRVRLPMRT